MRNINLFVITFIDKTQKIILYSEIKREPENMGPRSFCTILSNQHIHISLIHTALSFEKGCHQTRAGMGADGGADIGVVYIFEAKGFL